MLTLTLLRHAKSSWEDIELDDFERPLSKRGAGAAPQMGRVLRDLNLKPDLVLCSTAVRTRATLALVLLELGPPPPTIEFDDKLYLASPAAMLARIRKVSGAYRHVMLVGHNPGTHALALELTGAAKPADIAELSQKFPTAGLANMTFDVDRWSAVAPAGGHLVVFITPRMVS
jgi:phosphohistidine phosphatase